MTRLHPVVLGTPFTIVIWALFWIVMLGDYLRYIPAPNETLPTFREVGEWPPYRACRKASPKTIERWYWRNAALLAHDEQFYKKRGLICDWDVMVPLT